MREPRVVVIGDALIDEIRDGTESRDFVGGAALNVAVGLAVLGVRTALVAMVGDDDDGVAIRHHLDAHGVGLLATTGPHGSSRAVSERIDGEPRYTFNAAAQQRRVVLGAAARAALDGASHVVISCFPFDDADQRRKVLRAIGDRPRRLIVDPNPRLGMMRDLAEFRRGVAEVASACRLIKIGADDAQLLYESSVDEAAEMLLGLGGTTVLTTAGSAGAALYAGRGEEHRVPVAELPGPIVDTMGAGDATLAAVSQGICDADSTRVPVQWDTVLRVAMRVAAATCRAPGALLRMP